MKKFIVAFDGLDFNEAALRYAVFMSRKCGAHLVGVFLEDFTRRSYGMKELAAYEGPDRDNLVKSLDARDNEKRLQSINQFENACQQQQLRYSVHRNRDVALQELLEESIYADLLIISARETMTGYEEEVPSRYVREVLNDVQCPVLLTPEAFVPFSKVVLLYDGELSSVNAVKAFSYISDQSGAHETEVVTVKQPDETAHLPHNRLIKEFIKRHYPHARFVLLQGDAEEEILNYVKKDADQSLVVLGAYRRSKLSRLFRASMADRLLQHTQRPLFIAHNKV